MLSGSAGREFIPLLGERRASAPAFFRTGSCVLSGHYELEIDLKNALCKSIHIYDVCVM